MCEGGKQSKKKKADMRRQDAQKCKEMENKDTVSSGSHSQAKF